MITINYRPEYCSIDPFKIMLDARGKGNEKIQKKWHNDLEKV